MKSQTIALKQTKFTKVQIVFFLRLANARLAVAEVRWKVSISEATCYKLGKIRWPGRTETALSEAVGKGEPNAQQLVADLSLDK